MEIDFFKAVYSVFCLILCVFFITALLVVMLGDLRRDKWYRVGVLFSKYPKSKKKENIKVLVTTKKNEVKEAFFYVDGTYKFSENDVIAWRYYPKPFRTYKGLIGFFVDLYDKNLAKKIEKESKK